MLMTKDTWLNDRIMEAAQKLICKVLGKIGSFQSVPNPQKRSNYPFRVVKNEYIQLLHDVNNHWLLSFCSSGRVQICESHAGWFTLRSLNSLYQNFKDTSNGKLTLSFLLVQKQDDGFNCVYLPWYMSPRFYMESLPLMHDLMYQQ